MAHPGGYIHIQRIGEFEASFPIQAVPLFWCVRSDCPGAHVTFIGPASNGISGLEVNELGVPTPAWQGACRSEPVPAIRLGIDGWTVRGIAPRRVRLARRSVVILIHFVNVHCSSFLCFQPCPWRGCQPTTKT